MRIYKQLNRIYLLVNKYFLSANRYSCPIHEKLYCINTLARF